MMVWIMQLLRFMMQQSMELRIGPQIDDDVEMVKAEDWLRYRQPSPFNRKSDEEQLRKSVVCGTSVKVHGSACSYGITTIRTSRSGLNIL